MDFIEIKFKEDIIMKLKKNCENRFLKNAVNIKESNLNKNNRKENDRLVESEELNALKKDSYILKDVPTNNNNAFEQKESYSNHEHFGKKTFADINEKITKEIREKAEESRNARENIVIGKEVLFDIIIDGTYSFTTVFPKIYYILQNLTTMIYNEKLEYEGIGIKYGLTVLHKNAEAQVFKNNEYFTESEQEFLQELRNIEFYGGSENGRENLKEALDTGLRILNNCGEDNTYRGLLLFSDSLPEEEDLTPDFSQYNQNEYLNKGLRFAIFYTYKNDFFPKLKIVDGDGNITENVKNEVAFNNLEDLLSLNGNNLIEQIRRMIINIFNQTSILGYR